MTPRRQGWAAFWLMVIVMFTVAGAGFVFLERARAHTPAIIENYRTNRLGGGLLEEVLTVNIKTMYVLLVGQIVFAGLWFMIGYHMGKYSKPVAAPSDKGNAEGERS
jgi:hypothetical protein